MMKPFTKVAMAVFVVIGLFHIARLVYSWQAMIGTVQIPLWLSAVGAAVTLTLAWGLKKEM